jgi:hypothetical protein
MLLLFHFDDSEFNQYVKFMTVIEMVADSGGGNVVVS